MRITNSAILVLLTLTAGLPAVVHAQASGAYVPPMRGAPSIRVSGGSRGEAQAGRLELLAPDHTGLSATAQPSLYWHLSEPLPYPVVLTILDPDEIDPLFEAEIAAQARGGVQGADLRALDVTLAPEVDYQWSISVVENPEQHSLDRFASGQIRYQPYTGKVTGTDLQQARQWAGRGYWYDAISASSRHPSGDTVAFRNAICKQVGLQVD